MRRKKNLKENKIYHRDGSIRAKGKMVDGISDGYWEWFRKDGTRMRSGNFVMGKQVGEWITYDKKGKCYKINLFDKKKTDFKMLSAPAQRALANAHITTIAELAKWSEEKLLTLHGMGPSSLPKLRTALKASGKSFKVNK